MAVVMGVHPGGRGHFAISALFWPGRLPALMFAQQTFSGVQEVLDNITGVCGEWGQVQALAVDAPLTWSARVGGRRTCDDLLRSRMPGNFPRNYLRAPNVLPGATTIQGPALVWAMAKEAKAGLFTEPSFFETNARASLFRLASDRPKALLGYRSRELGAIERRRLVEVLFDKLVDAGLLKVEAPRPKIAAEIESITSALTALAHVFPEAGFVLRHYDGEAIRPVGRRSLVIIDAPP